MQRLLNIMSRLRDPETGCPWDREQSFASIAPYTIEEAYEVADAIECQDLTHLKNELGDLLFQVVFHSQLAQEQGAFQFADVVVSICDKLERRHPHVFVTATDGGNAGNAGAVSSRNAHIANAQQQNIAWETHKRQERAANNPNPSALDDVPLALPALKRASKLGKRASGIGFDWPDMNGALDKIEEELAELRVAIKAQSAVEIREEVGDFLFSIVNLARHLGVDAENALHATNRKFERRFRHVEAGLKAQNKTPSQATLAEMDALWDQAKSLENKALDGSA